MPDTLAPATSRPERVSILLVDGNPTNLLSLRALLDGLGQNLVEARSGEEALERTKADEFAVILLDVLTPGINGFETAKAIRSEERSKHTPLIFLTASDNDRSQMEQGYALGAVDYLVKPVLPVALQAKVRGFVQLFQDKQQARHEADQLRLLVHGTTEYAIFMLDPQGRVVTWNAGAERIKGYKADEIIGQHFTKFYPQEAIDRGWPAHELKVATAEGRFEDEGWRVRKDGTQFWANVVITALRDEHGELRGFSKVTRDLTARKDAEEALRQSEERFRLLVETATDYAIFVLDQQGYVASWNAGAERIKQYKADEIIGQHFSKFYPQEALDRGWPAHELKVAEAVGRFEDEGWRVRKDGTQFWANVVITALKDEHGVLRGFSKITRDITERMRSEETARRLIEEATARRVAEENSRLVQEQRERLHVTLASIGDAVISTDAEGRVDFLNPVAQELVGWNTEEAAKQNLSDVFRIVNEDTRQPVENPALRALKEGVIVGLANHTVLIAKNGIERPIDDSAAPIRNAEGKVIGSVLVFRDISERKRFEATLNERLRLLSLNASVGEALAHADELRPMLQRCSEALVEHLHGAFARIWTMNAQEDVLELQASAGLYIHLDGPHSRVPVGKYKIGLIAQERKPHLTNTVATDPRVSDQKWAQREGMVAFAGYPLLVDDRLVGVMAMFARQPLSNDTLEAMASVANGIAVGVERKVAEEERRQQQEWLRVTLASIGDAMIATDTDGRLTFLNDVAQELTGWRQADAKGQPLETVFTILNEQTRQPVENPVKKVLRDGVVIGLGNHTVLIAKDGAERPIDDSAAPIRDTSGRMIGVVLIFRDVTEQRRAERQLRASEARKSAILETALDCIITIDHEGNVVEFNPAAEKTFGYRHAEVMGKELAHFIIPPAFREQHRRGMAHYLATSEGPVLGKRLELPALRADGTEFPAELAITRISTDGPPQFTAYLRDITEQKRAEQHRNVRLGVTHALSEASGVDDGASGVLRAVCENLGWDVGFVWNVNDKGDRLVCRASWHRANVMVTDFETASRSRMFAKGEGLLGRVWESGKPAWILDVLQENSFPRIASAAKDGLHSAFICPIVVGDRTLGVIEFFTTRIREADADLLETMGTVAGSVGQFLERKSAEEQVSQSERELADFFENATVGLHWVGSDGTILRVNRAELAMLGYSREEYVGRPIADFHADEETICDILMRLQAGEQLDEYPARLRCKDGSIKYVLIDSSVMWKDGKFAHTRCFTRDVTERRKGEAVLAGQKRVLELLVQDAPLPDVLDALCAVIEGQAHDRLVATVLLVDERGGRLRSVAGRRAPAEYARAVDGVGIGPCAGSCGTAAFRGEPVVVTDIATDPLWASYRELALGHGLRACWSTPVRSSHGKVLGTFAVYYPTPRGPTEGERRLVDILISTASVAIERRRAEAALRESEQTARFLAEASAALAVLVDFDSTLQKIASLAVPSFADWASVDLIQGDGMLRRVAVAHVNPSKVELAHELHRRFPPDPAAPQGVWNILRTGKAEIVSEINDELLIQSVKDDELLRTIKELGLKSYVGVPLKVRGKVIGVITFIAAESGRCYDEADLVTAQDLADRAAIALDNAELYRELRDADRRKDEFLATLAHELRNPLAPIRNGLQVLRLAGGGGEMVEEALSMMERQVSQMVRLVDDLLDVSRITRDKLELRKQRVTLAAVINSAVETSRPLMEQAGHTFSLALLPAPVYLDADLTRLAQVFSNLLNNAAKYTEQGGRISLTGELSDCEVVVRVRDNGMGIPTDALPHIFEMFSQVDRNMERAQGGLGIGLTLVRRLVEMHGGMVQARSEGPGQGSEFVVRLPVLETGQPTPAAHDDERKAATTKRRILVVDDNRDSATSLGMMLNLMGNVTHTVHDGLTAVEAAEQFRPDMILLDIGLPKMNGYDACRVIRQHPWSKGIVIVALTGWGQEADRRRSVEAGFDHHLVKPVELAALDRLLAAPEPQSPSLQQSNPNQVSLRVLVVDDRRDATFMLRTLLDRAGHDVRTAADGPSALALAHDFRPEVVLLDIGLPGMSGLEVAKRIRQESTLKDIVLIAMTGHGEDDDRQRSFEAGFDYHLVKPADISIVHEILATVKVNAN